MHDTLHTHADGHEHSHEIPKDTEVLKPVLSFMLEHNKQHVAETGEIAHKLHHAGQNEAADMIEAAIADYESGNEKLGKALELIK